jgi:hypothetical protein
MITDVLQKKIFMLVHNYKNTNDTSILLLIKELHNYKNKLNCIKTVNQDKLYDTYRVIYNTVLLDIIGRHHILFISY